MSERKKKRITTARLAPTESEKNRLRKKYLAQWTKLSGELTKEEIETIARVGIYSGEDMTLGPKDLLESGMYRNAWAVGAFGPEREPLVIDWNHRIFMLGDKLGLNLREDYRAGLRDGAEANLRQPPTVATPTDKNPAKKRRSGRGSYPWDVCIEEQTERYGSEATAAKVCGSIRAKSLQANPIRVQNFKSFCEAVADAYDQAPSVEEVEVWRWEKLADHIRRFYDRVRSQVEVIFVDGQPYDSAEQMREEVVRTGTLLISRDYNEHPVFDPETNLMFRTVHDYVVHIAPGMRGPDFSQRGEIRAYNLHRRLAPPDTWPALFSEVLAQACYFNVRGEFPEQKVAILPGFDFYNVGLDEQGNTIGDKKKARAKSPKKSPKKAKGIKNLVAEALR